MYTSLQELVLKWHNTGRVFHFYPRKKVISLNGMAPISQDAAIAYLKDFFTLKLVK